MNDRAAKAPTTIADQAGSLLAHRAAHSVRASKRCITTWVV